MIKHLTEFIHGLVNNKKVLILGYGREGRSTLPVVIEAGGAAVIAVADAKPVKDGLPEGVTAITGEEYLGCLNDFDVVFKSPGIVLDREINDYTCNIVSQMEVFFECFRDRIIGITGTKGKSTTTTLLYHVLKSSGKDVLLAGNIGIPVFEIADGMSDTTTAVLELSCHQLEYMDVSPHMAIYLNLHEEHLDHYGTMAKYTAAKENIYRHQKAGDKLYCLDSLRPHETLPADVYTFRCGACSGADYSLSSGTIYYKDEDNGKCEYRIPVGDIKLIGEHNYFDIAFVYAACRDCGVTDEQFTRALLSYEPLPHRLQYVGTINGIKWYDDSISTIDETTIQALNTLKDADTVLIGGMDRGISYKELEQYLAHSDIKNIILMEASGKRILEEIELMKGEFESPERIHYVQHLEDAVSLAADITGAGRSCVMSPAAASYGIFRNFEERGEVFKKLVSGMEKNA
ncbi:MAG TPA: UDP-N-acetylmuramoyl-L-alanine--D-glutamate ligase [Bacteroides sp.]|nr:UDP-N-acetylmuramoyl-L-alanine--D-glutamate ligase [Bacteroides sp.]